MQRWKQHSVHQRVLRWGVVLLAGVLVLAACGGDDDSAGQNEPAADPTATGSAPVFNTGPSLNTGPDLAVGGAPDGASGDERQLPGCADPDSDECPSPLQVELDTTVTAENVTLSYYGRYWEALTGEAAGDALVRIQPTDKNKFDLKGTFEVTFAESVDAALTSLGKPEPVAWETANLGGGVVATVHDDTVEPPVATVCGVFERPDGRAIVLTMIATGKYSLDFHQDVYTAMLDSLVVND